MGTIQEPPYVAVHNVPTLTALARMMATTHPAHLFWAFQVRLVKASDSRLAKDKFSHEQDRLAWDDFILEMSRDRRLLQYSRLWPVRVAWDHRVSKSLNIMPRHRGRPPKRTINESGGSVSHPELRRDKRFLPQSVDNPPSTHSSVSTMRTSIIRVFVGKPPPDMKKGAVVWSTPPGNDDDDELAVAPCSDLPWTQLAKTAMRTSIEIVRVGCFDCGRPLPWESAGLNKNLRALIGKDPEQLKVLFLAGLVDDSHLAIFLSWSPHHRNALIQELETTSFIWKSLIKKILPAKDRLAVEHGSKKRKERGEAPSDHPAKRAFSGIPQPGAADEEDMTDPSKSISLLFDAMDLGENEDLFDEILALVETHGMPYLQTYRPSAQKFEDVVKTVSTKKFVFERYNNHWPIRFMLKRFARKAGCKPQDGHLELLQRGSGSPTSKGAAVPSGHQYPVFPWIDYTCPVHPGVDVNKVCESTKRFLHHRGLSELIPVFASVGIRTHADLLQYCAFSEEEKDDVLAAEHVQKVKLNPFQRLALKVEFESGKAPLYHV